VLLHGVIFPGSIGWADPTQPSVGEVLAPITPSVKTLSLLPVSDRSHSAIPLYTDDIEKDFLRAD
jgi:hypothetical protein